MCVFVQRVFMYMCIYKVNLPACMYKDAINMMQLKVTRTDLSPALHRSTHAFALKRTHTHTHTHAYHIIT